MDVISNSWVVVGRFHAAPDLEVHLNLMHVFGCILSSDDENIHMCCYALISLIIVRFVNPNFFI